MNKTFIPNKKNYRSKSKWYLIDAKEQKLGRLSSKISILLRGKNNSYYTPHQINNSYVIVVNAEKIQVSGNKKLKKNYYRHSGRPGGLKTENFEHLYKRMPERIIEKAVKGMLPKNTLGRELFKHLKVYKGRSHPHNAQQNNIITL